MKWKPDDRDWYIDPTPKDSSLGMGPFGGFSMSVWERLAGCQSGLSQCASQPKDVGAWTNILGLFREYRTYIYIYIYIL